MENIPQEQSAEINGDKRADNKPGLYEHPKSGAKLLALNPQQGDAFVRLQYEWVRDLEESDFYVPTAPTSPVDDAKAEMDAMLAEAKKVAAQIIADAQKEAKKAKKAPKADKAVETNTENTQE